jgi:hypothetical protein
MRRPKVITEKELIKIEKEAQKVKELQEKIKIMYEKLRDFNDNNSWIRYLSREMQEDLTTDQGIRLNDAIYFIVNAEKFDT